MKKILIIVGILVLLLSNGYAQSGIRFLDRVFHSVNITPSRSYSSAVPVGDDDETILLYDFYEPANDTMAARPLVITVFGGAFVAGNRRYADMVAIADTLAHYGYAVASIDYRLLPVLSLSKRNFIRGAYMASQDVNAAIRYFKGNADTYKIDTNQIFLLGNSAGTIAALHASYFDNDSRPSETYAQDDDADLGGINSSGSPEYARYSAKVAGIVAQWGCVMDTNIVTPAKNTPVCLLHGTADQTIPYESGIPYEAKYGSLATLILPKVYGSYYIDKMLTRNQIEHEFHSFEGEKHCFYLDEDNNLLPEKLDTCLRIAIAFMAKYNTHLNDEAIVVDRTLPDSFIVYPNPARDQISLKLDLDNQKFEYEIYDIHGKVCLQGKNKRNVSLRKLVSGSYIIKVKTDLGVLYSKFIKK